jgi:hypothetical protein
MPRQLQRWVLLAVTVVMVGIMALSAGPRRPVRSGATTTAAAVVRISNG